MSKKIAEGVDALVLDVKTGSGAFLRSPSESRTLAQSLVALGNASGVRTEAVMTDMEGPLGCQVGNALEVIECLEVLKGRGPSDLVALSVELTSRMLVLGGQTPDQASAEQRVRDAIASGDGLERFRRIVEHQGGDPWVVDDYSRLPSAPHVRRVTASRPGFVTALDARLVGRASMALGAGRDRVEDVVDPAVGISILAKPGTEVRAGDPVLELHYRTESALDAAWPMATGAVALGDTPPTIGPIVLEHFS
jgi:thymidine phosphorylase